MTDWPHAPIHRFVQPGTYFITAGTFYKKHLWNTPEKLDYLESLFFQLLNEYNMLTQGWVFLKNHYHILIFTNDNPIKIPEFLARFHNISAHWLNNYDNIHNRQVWYEYWDKLITYQKSYLARIKYINRNPEHHHAVGNSVNYKWCSYSWFEQRSEYAFRKTVNSFKIDKLKIYDDF